jgi:hypothetical protein
MYSMQSKDIGLVRIGQEQMLVVVIYSLTFSRSDLVRCTTCSSPVVSRNKECFRDVCDPLHSKSAMRNSNGAINVDDIRAYVSLPMTPARSCLSR